VQHSDLIVNATVVAIPVAPATFLAKDMLQPHAHMRGWHSPAPAHMNVCRCSMILTLMLVPLLLLLLLLLAVAAVAPATTTAFFRHMH